MLHAVIMAGGAGTRFWPESRADSPKQLLRLIGDESMLQATVSRLERLAPPERILIVTNERLVKQIQKQLPTLPAESIMGEPCKRDTAPCIGWSAAALRRKDPEAIMAVMPSDHVIRPEEKFRSAIEFAAELVQQSPGRIVTFGVRPTYPAESFGYIERGDELTGADEFKAFQVANFREKPDAATAQQYLNQGSFYWNSGIFVWSATTILDQIAEHRPDLYAHLERITEAIETDGYAAVVAKEFDAMQPVSIDYAVMEHAKDVVVVEAPFEWDDVGSWQAISRLEGEDAEGNTIDALHVGINTTGTIVRAPKDRLVATLGMKDCLIVQTADATLVANKNDEEAIREIVKLLRERGLEHWL